MNTVPLTFEKPAPWNKAKLVGQKSPLKLKDIWAMRVRLQLAHRTRDLALFNLANDSKLRACDLIKLHVSDVAHGHQIAPRAMVLQHKTQRPVSSKSPIQLGSRLPRGLKKLILVAVITSFRADYTTRHIYRRGSTPGSCMDGLTTLDWIACCTARTQCGEPRFR